MRTFLRVFFFTVFIYLTQNSIAQDRGCPHPPCPPPAPISGIEYLIGMGGLYGVRKLIKSHRKLNR